MHARRIAYFIAAIVLVAVLALTWARRRPGLAVGQHAPTPEGRAGPLGPPRIPGAPSGRALPSNLATLAAEIRPDAISPIATELNSPHTDIHRDLEIVNEVLGAWQTNFPRDGNPVGENDEITLALAGANRLHFAFIAPTHPAINVRGELCDRWGTPFRFHALSGTHMEIRSAGADRKFATPDDVQFAPGGNSP